ncbi:MAG: CPBP family intramembrane metalloprotease [Actinomycetota bacterium]|nr:CPBP family intramembrane metalloprotease [Actinomycetota bacterium]
MALQTGQHQEARPVKQVAHADRTSDANHIAQQTAFPDADRPPRRRGVFWTVLAAVEVAVAAAAVVADVFVPTFIILAVATISLAVRREGLSTLGFVRPPKGGRMAAQVLGLVVVWTLLQLAVFMPILEHLTGDRQDLTDFDDLEGNLGLLIAMIVLSWTLAAVGEEAAYRGLVHTRITDLVGTQRNGVAIAVVASAVLFGFAHTEQGTIGVVVTFLDALAFGYLRTRYATLWAPVLAHGLNNTIGLTAFYFAGPIYGLW